MTAPRTWQITEARAEATELFQPNVVGHGAGQDGQGIDVVATDELVDAVALGLRAQLAPDEAEEAHVASESRVARSDDDRRLKVVERPDQEPNAGTSRLAHDGARGRVE